MIFGSAIRILLQGWLLNSILYFRHYFRKVNDGRKPDISSPAMRWAVDAQNHDFASSVFKSIVVANGLRVLLERDLTDAREQLRADSIPGQCILWWEDDDCRSLLFSVEGTGSIVLISQVVAEVEISVASNDL